MFDPTIGSGTRFKKGSSGNPGGRPRTRLLSEALRDRLGELKPDDPAGRTYAEVVAANLVAIASEAEGSEAVSAAGLIADRIEGKVKQQVKIGGLAAELNTPQDLEVDTVQKFDSKFWGAWRIPVEYATDYYWVVICKNHRFHHKGNTSYEHHIRLGETDAYSALPMLTEKIVVRCDNCGEEYSYKLKEVIRAEIEVLDGFIPHPYSSKGSLLPVAV